MLSHSVLGRLGRDAFYRSCATQTVRDPQSQVEFAFLEDELVYIESSRKVTFHRSIAMKIRLANADLVYCSKTRAMLIAFSWTLICAH